jgi:TPR repeat protein
MPADRSAPVRAEPPLAQSATISRTPAQAAPRAAPSLREPVSPAAVATPEDSRALSDSERVDEVNQDKLLIQGLRLLVLGNINSARLLFERAAQAGNARAALILGDTFDEARLVQLGVIGVLPDRDKAAHWYERADELGAPEAKERLSELNAR